MKNISKQFVEWVTGLKNNTFLKAKLKLTLYYTIGLFIIVIIFSFFVYLLFVNNMMEEFETEREEYGKSDDGQETIIIENAIDRLRTILIFTDIGIVIVVSGFGYFLAGRTLQPIKKSLEDQKRFISDSAHEFRTPLTVMKTGIETVAAGKRQTLEEYKRLNKDLFGEVNKLINISDDLLFLARSDTGKLENRMTRINISSICLDQIKLVRPYANKEGINIEVDIERSCYIKGNDNQLKRLIMNLLKNAVDYNKKEGTVSVSIKESKGIITLCILDSGIGITSDDLKHIFERFYKADESRSVYGKGSGLGLSIVKEIVNYHNGTITINSEPEKGTEVIVRFKLFK